MKILVFPYDKNPYQKLLYSAMRKKYGKQVKIRYAWFLPFVGALHFPLEIAVRRLIGYKRIHIHWVAFYLRQNVPKNKLISWYITRFNFWWMKRLGYKLIWTVHDIVPHQQETIDDLDISKRLAKIVDVKIIHSSYTRDQLKSKGLNSDGCVVIPHGNYDGIYTNNTSREQARKNLHIAPDKKVILFFGIIKAYKGIDELLNNYDKIRDKNTMLVIAGKCTDEHLINLLNSYETRPDVIIHNKYIDDNDVATYFAVADMVCLPFKAITTSGSTLLALTYGKPIIAPRQGSLKDIPAEVGYLYEPSNNTGLKDAMRLAIHDKHLKSKAAASRSYADSLAWERIAQKTYKVYRTL